MIIVKEQFIKVTDVINGRVRSYGYEAELEASQIFASNTWTKLKHIGSSNSNSPIQEPRGSLSKKISLMYIDKEGFTHPAIMEGEHTFSNKPN